MNTKSKKKEKEKKKKGKNPKTTVADVTKFLKKSGYIFEMEMAKALRSKGYKTLQNRYFLDLEENKKREIDIIASKEVNDIRIYLVIECKQSLKDDWIFICSEQSPERFYTEVKHLPMIELSKIRDQKIFDMLHILDYKKPLAQNYITFEKKRGKKGKGEQIESSLIKLPKILIYAGSKLDYQKRTIFLPIILFSGKIFSARYSDKLVVKEEGLMQFQRFLDSDAYTEKQIESKRTYSALIEPYIFDPKKEEIDKIISIAQSFGNLFLIDVISKNSLKRYLSMVEREISKISIDKWAIKPKKSHSLLAGML